MTLTLRSILPCSPAGAIYSSADDMAKWMTFLLSEGQGPNGSTLVDPRVLHMTWQPSMLLFSSNKDLQRPLSPVSHVTRGYGLGWQAASYRGKHFHCSMARKCFKLPGSFQHLFQLGVVVVVFAFSHLNCKCV